MPALNRERGNIMDEKLREISAGLHQDQEGALYIRWGQFLAAHNLPDGPEVRQAVRENIKSEFGNVTLKEAD